MREMLGTNGEPSLLVDVEGFDPNHVGREPRPVDYSFFDDIPY